MAVLITTRGPKVGTCNICGDYGALTEDHTPPKGCLKPTQVQLHHIMQLLAAEPPKTKPRISQNGVKYRTLCHRCNNTLLGRRYDPAFISFVNEIAGFLTSSLKLPNALRVRARPQPIMRALLGHIAAQGVDRYQKGPLTEAIRDYFLDASLPLPDGIRIFYWPYPYRPHVMARDAAFLHIPTGKPFAFWLLKFFPVAFLVAWDEPHGVKEPIEPLHIWRHIGFNDELELRLMLKPIPPLYWPEAPTDESVILYGQEALFAKGMHTHVIQAGES